MANNPQESPIWKEKYYRNLTDKIKSSVRIVEYAAQIGLTPVMLSGGKYYSLKEHDSVIINPRTNLFYRNQNDAHGDILDFVCEFENKTPSQAFKTLVALVDKGSYVHPVSSSISPITSQTQATRPFSLPLADNSTKNVYAYLVGTRKINPEIVNWMLKSKHLYQDTHKNCVFVSYNAEGQANFASKRGTNTYKKFVADVSGSDYKHCFYINNHAATMVITESVIDSMSVMSIMRDHGRNLNQYNFLSLNGVSKYRAVKNHLLEHPEISSVVISTDNDAGGINAISNIKNDLQEMNWQGKIIEFLPPSAKDWNAQLQQDRTQQAAQKKIIEQEQTEELEN